MFCFCFVCTRCEEERKTSYLVKLKEAILNRNHPLGLFWAPESFIRSKLLGSSRFSFHPIMRVITSATHELHLSNADLIYSYLPSGPELPEAAITLTFHARYQTTALMVLFFWLAVSVCCIMSWPAQVNVSFCAALAEHPTTCVSIGRCNSYRL